MSETKQAIVIDDDPLIRSLLKAVLTHLGYEAYTYECALDVPCIANHHTEHCPVSGTPPELLIIDIKMTGMTGIEFLLNVDRIGCKIKKKAIMSGYWTDNYTQKAKELGCRKFEKPFNMDEIKEWVLEQ
jgi:two-component system response regulator (stage 0 sporulation protein F)